MTQVDHYSIVVTRHQNGLDLDGEPTVDHTVEVRAQVPSNGKGLFGANGALRTFEGLCEACLPQPNKEPTIGYQVVLYEVSLDLRRPQPTYKTVRTRPSCVVPIVGSEVWNGQDFRHGDPEFKVREGDCVRLGLDIRLDNMTFEGATLERVKELLRQTLENEYPEITIEQARIRHT